MLRPLLFRLAAQTCRSVMFCPQFSRQARVLAASTNKDKTERCSQLHRRNRSCSLEGTYPGPVKSGATVIVGSDGHLGTVVSSARFKEAIKPMDEASEALLALKPVTFRYKHELDPDGIPQFVVAEQVERVNPDLVVRDENGKVSTVRYEAVNAMLLNEFLKEHRKVEERQATIGELKSAAAAQRKQIETITATVQNVSEKTELSKAVQVVANDNKKCFVLPLIPDQVLTSNFWSTSDAAVYSCRGYNCGLIKSRKLLLRTFVFRFA